MHFKQEINSVKWPNSSIAFMYTFKYIDMSTFCTLRTNSEIKDWCILFRKWIDLGQQGDEVVYAYRSNFDFGTFKMMSYAPLKISKLLVFRW